MDPATEMDILMALYDECTQYYDWILRQALFQLGNSSAEYCKLEEQYRSLCLWRQHEPSSKALEPLVRISKTLVDRLAPRLTGDITEQGVELSNQNLLALIGRSESLMQEDLGLPKHDQHNLPDDEASLVEIAADLVKDIVSLLNLDPLAGLSDQDVHLLYTDINQYYVDSIKEQFHSISPDLADSLGHANMVRSLRVRAQREKNQRLLDSIQPRSESAAGESSSQDSGCEATEEANTALSSDHDQDEPLEMIDLPRYIQSGESFQCTACAKWVAFTNPSEWRRHVRDDLQPYVCTIPRCPHALAPFPTRQEWAQHLILEYDLTSPIKEFMCPLCQEAIGSEQPAIIDHLAPHLEEISLAAVPYNSILLCDSDLSSSYSWSSDEPEDAEYQCWWRDCDSLAIFTKRKDLLRHVMQCHVPSK